MCKGGPQGVRATLTSQYDQQRVSGLTQNPQETAAKVSIGGVLEPVRKEPKPSSRWLSWGTFKLEGEGIKGELSPPFPGNQYPAHSHSP